MRITNLAYSLGMLGSSGVEEEKVQDMRLCRSVELLRECSGEDGRICGTQKARTRMETEMWSQDLEESGHYYPLGTLEGDAGKRSYQERDDASSTGPVACRVQSPVWLVYDILEKRALVTPQAGAVEIRRK